MTEMIKRVIHIDKQEFSRQHEEFRIEPENELRYGLQLLNEQPIYKERYNKFIGPLVYHPSPPSPPSPPGWEAAIASVVKMTEECGIGLRKYP